MKNFFLFIALICVGFSCVTIKKNSPADGSLSLSKKDSTYLTSFDLESAFVDHNYNSPKDIKYQIMDARNLEELLKKKPYNWILIGSSWCPIVDFEFKNSAKVYKQFPKDSVQFIFISQDINIKLLNKMIMEAGFNGVPYFIDPVKYGTDEKMKQANFYHDLLWNEFPSRYYETGGVPRMFLLRKDVELLLLGGYQDSNPDTIKKYTGLNYKEI